MENKHAVLGASKSHRWLVCPPIIRLEELCKEKSDSSFAIEGNEAHELAEIKLCLAVDGASAEIYESEMKTFASRSKYYDEAMDEYTNMYVDYVMEAWYASQGGSIDFEKHISYERWVPNGFGTCDVVIKSTNTIEIIDFKYGKGIKVEAEQNPQLMLYALGAYSTTYFKHDIQFVRMTIVQPRLDHISSFEIDVEELLYWADNYVAPRAAQAYEGIGEWDITVDVLRFSPIRGQLRPRALRNFELISKYDFEEPALLNGDEVSEILKLGNEIIKWVADVQDYALQQALKGETVKGYKLVEGKSKRQVVDTDELADILKSNGVDESMIYKPKEMFGITALEKSIGKPIFKKLAEGYIYRPKGKPVLVPVSDKRPELYIDPDDL